MEISVILPTYNEGDNIKILIPKLEQLFKNEKIDSEIIVVDDSSPDGTAKIASNFNKKYKNIKTLVRERKEGLGSALRNGYNHANGDIIISMDSDLSLDIKDIPKFIEKIESGYDLVVGSRFLKHGFYEKKRIRTYLKNLVSTFGNRLTTFLLDIDIHDFSLNFRAIKKSIWKSIETREKLNAFLLEMIVKTKYSGFKVTEVPVIFKERYYGKSKMKLSKQTFRFFRKLFEYFITYRLFLPSKSRGGKYK